MKGKASRPLRWIIAIAVSQLAGIIGSIFTAPAISGWYASLAKPELAPPNWVFGPVWITLFVLMGIAAALVWEKGIARKDVRTALAFFGIQLALNAGWSAVFFGLRSPGAAFVEIILLWLAIMATMVSFAKVSRLATWLLLPYILWVSFAGYLTLAIWRLNG